MANPRLTARLNRWLDALQDLGRPRRAAFRRRLLAVVQASQRDWPHADYGAGYLYQSCPALGLRGFRDTAARVAQMNLGPALAGRSVLEIGCNSGFLSLALAAGTRRYLAFDNNPFLVEMARLSQAELQDRRVEFCVEGFETLGEDETFDAVLSFANHSTWDGNMTLDLERYFAKLHRLLVPSGTLYFESHHPALEDAAALQGTLGVMERHFALQSQRLLGGGSAWDRGRTFVVARAR